jgi:aminoglycoside phosphotransferase (APT) family kinase protein
MGREYRILALLQGVYPKAPRPLLYCEDPSVIGAPFYVMQRVRGVILRHPLPQGLLLDPSQMRRISIAVVDTLAELHAVDFRAAGLAELSKAQGYVARQVHGWTQRYNLARTHDVPDLERVAAWLAAGLESTDLPGGSGDSRAGLIHNDFKLDNLILDPHDLTQVAAVLDWEMATIGEPLMDLGTTLAYWIQEDDPVELRRIGLVGFKGSLRRNEVVARYAERRGTNADDVQAQIPFYYVFGLFKVAVIAQQIYYRYRQGHTQDPRFGGLDAVVAACAGMAVRVLESGQIE